MFTFIFTHSPCGLMKEVEDPMCIPSEEGDWTGTKGPGEGTCKLGLPGDGAIIFEGEGVILGPREGGEASGKLDPAGDGWA